MKIIFLSPIITCLLLMVVKTGFSQAMQPMNDGETLTINGFEVSYFITSKRKISVKRKGERADFDRYEVTFQAINRGGMTFLPINEFSEGSTLEIPLLATFFCRNATGARLTGTQVDIPLNVHYVSYDQGNTIDQVPAGFYIEAGETLVDNLSIFIVPKGEEPDIICQFLFNY